MREYVLRVILLAIAAGICDSFLPPGNKAKSFVRLAAGLAVLVVLAAPLAGFFRDLSFPGLSSFDALIGSDGDGDGDAAKYGEILRGKMEDVVRSELTRAIGEDLSARFSVEEADIGVDFSSGDALLPVKVWISLYGKDIFRDPRKIEDYFSGLLGCECIVSVNFTSQKGGLR